jgi:hypothetical protein
MKTKKEEWIGIYRLIPKINIWVINQIRRGGKMAFWRTYKFSQVSTFCRIWWWKPNHLEWHHWSCIKIIFHLNWEQEPELLRRRVNIVNQAIDTLITKWKKWKVPKKSETIMNEIYTLLSAVPGFEKNIVT